MVLFGGHNRTRHLYDINLYKFGTGVWASMVVGGGPSARDSHVSVVYGDAM